MNVLLSTSSLSEGEVAVLFWATIGGGMGDMGGMWGY
jgi:hypothetical protein